MAQNLSSVENRYLNSLRGQTVPYTMDITFEQVSILKLLIGKVRSGLRGQLAKKYFFTIFFGSAWGGEKSGDRYFF